MICQYVELASNQSIRPNQSNSIQPLQVSNTVGKFDNNVNPNLFYTKNASTSQQVLKTPMPVPVPVPLANTTCICQGAQAQGSGVATALGGVIRKHGPNPVACRSQEVNNNPAQVQSINLHMDGGLCTVCCGMRNKSRMNNCFGAMAAMGVDTSIGFGLVVRLQKNKKTYTYWAYWAMVCPGQHPPNFQITILLWHDLITFMA